MDPVSATAGISALFLSLAMIVLIVAADKTRYLAQFDFAHFNERSYLSLLPNFLQLLSDAGFTSPWPWRMDAVSAAYFRHQVRRVVKGRPRLARGAFLHQHLNLQALLLMLAPFIDDAILAEQGKVAAQRVLTMADTSDRDRLIQFVDEVRAHRARFFSTLTSLDRQLIGEMHRRDFLGTLKSANAMFHEHGFTDPLPALDRLRRWHTLEGTEMVQELPRLHKLPTRGAGHSTLLPRSEPGETT